MGAARRAATATISLCSTLLTLGLLEVAARFLADPTAGNGTLVALGVQARAASVWTASDDPELIYVDRPDYVSEGKRVTEAHGVVRASDVAVAKPPGTFRIAVLGDSIAAAHPLQFAGKPAFPDVLEAELNRLATNGTHYEVLNFGTDGYGSVQEARLLETRVAPFAPDLVIVAYCLNDPSNSYTPTVWFLRDPYPTSYLLDLVRRRLGGTPSELSPAHPRYTHRLTEWPRLYREDGAPWARVEDAFTRVARFGETRRIPTVLVLFPLLLTDRASASEAEDARRMCEQVRAAATRHGFHVVDLRATFAEKPVEEIRLSPADLVHPNALGHHLAAEATLAALRSDGLVP